ncbi:MAG: transcriptional regulator [Candidatus Pelagibacter sp.]|jgi:DNA-binding transcriptional MerR regulator|nr:transcriptional regulator [Candidatus Pelagibacter sp.]|tara:strand:- start:1718 stop:2110 length:393 start_codon:yes stop_codon:yes gene_type:complete
MEKKSEAYKTIGEVAKIVGLIDKKKGTLSTHTIRFWEKKFHQIKPIILSGRRRYYSNKKIHIIKLIKFLLKDKGMTIKGVKAMLNNPKSLTLDDTTKYSVTNQSLEKEKIKDKIKKISKIIDELRELKNG